MRCGVHERFKSFERLLTMNGPQRPVPCLIFLTSRSIVILSSLTTETINHPLFFHRK